MGLRLATVLLIVTLALTGCSENGRVPDGGLKDPHPVDGSGTAFDEAKAVELVLKDHPDFPEVGEVRVIETTTGGPAPGAKVSGELKTTVENTSEPSTFIVTLTKAWNITVNDKEAKSVWQYKVTPDNAKLVSSEENADIINTIK